MRRVRLIGTGHIHFGRHVRFLTRRAPIELHAHGDARIWIGDETVLEGGVSIEATYSVFIGARAHIGAFTKILDNHFHETTGDRSRRPGAVPVTIEDEAYVDVRTVVLPGAVVGRGAWVGPASVVSFAVPAGRTL